MPYSFRSRPLGGRFWRWNQRFLLQRGRGCPQFRHHAPSQGSREVFDSRVSMAGGIFHNLGQVLVASLVVANLKIMLYLPILAVAGAGTGLLIGITSVFTLRHLKKLPIYKRMQE